MPTDTPTPPVLDEARRDLTERLRLIESAARMVIARRADSYDDAAHEKAVDTYDIVTRPDAMVEVVELVRAALEAGEADTRYWRALGLAALPLLDTDQKLAVRRAANAARSPLTETTNG